MRPRRARRIARLYGGAELCGFSPPPTKKEKMTDTKINEAAQNYLNELTDQDDRRFTGFVAGAKWAIAQMKDENALKDLIAENDNLLDTLDDARDEITALRQKLMGGLKEIAAVRDDNNRLSAALRAIVERYEPAQLLHKDDWQLIENAEKALQ